MSNSALHVLLQLVLSAAFVVVFPVAPEPAPALSAQAAQAPAPQATEKRAAPRVDATRLMQDVQRLAAPELEGRLTGAAGSRKARALILDRFTQIGLQRVNGSYEQKFSFTRTRGGAKQDFPDAVNVFGLIPGTSDPEHYVLVTAHYDHLGVRDGLTYHGADDNASGVATMLALADWFNAHRPRRSLLFVAFDAEEQGLQGSKHFVAKPPIDLRRVTAVVNMDMVGRGDKNVIFVAGTSHYPALKSPVSEAAKGRSIIVSFGHDRQGVQGQDDWTHSSDHGPFHDAGVPFLYFGVEDHPDYHKPTDTAEKIPRQFYAEATELVLETVRRLAERGN